MNGIKNFIKSILGNERVVIYTAIFGSYDYLHKLPALPNCDFVCFTDDKSLQSSQYKVQYQQRVFDDPTRDARMYKILPHRYFPAHTYSLWIDGSILLREDFKIETMISRYLKSHDFAIFQHPDRNCVYEELEACINLKKDRVDVMQKQIEQYKADGYPEQNGLVASGCILRRHNVESVINLDEFWWDQVNAFSKRDQLSFNYAVWKKNFEYKSINQSIWNNKFFEYVGHK